jgi:hypothetical protein
MTATITENAEYIYQAGFPANCRGHRYRVVRVDVLLVPAYAKVVLVEALTGPDKGLLFVCSEANFASRYARIGN